MRITDKRTKKKQERENALRFLAAGLPLSESAKQLLKSDSNLNPKSKGITAMTEQLLRKYFPLKEDGPKAGSIDWDKISLPRLFEYGAMLFDMDYVPQDYEALSKEKAAAYRADLVASLSPESVILDLITELENQTVEATTMKTREQMITELTNLGETAQFNEMSDAQITALYNKALNTPEVDLDDIQDDEPTSVQNVSSEEHPVDDSDEEEEEIDVDADLDADTDGDEEGNDGDEEGDDLTADDMAEIMVDASYISREALDDMTDEEIEIIYQEYLSDDETDGDDDMEDDDVDADVADFMDDEDADFDLEVDLDIVEVNVRARLVVVLHASKPEQLIGNNDATRAVAVIADADAADGEDEPAPYSLYNSLLPSPVTKNNIMIHGTGFMRTPLINIIGVLSQYNEKNRAYVGNTAWMRHTLERISMNTVNILTDIVLSSNDVATETIDTVLGEHGLTLEDFFSSSTSVVFSAADTAEVTYYMHVRAPGILNMRNWEAAKSLMQNIVDTAAEELGDLDVTLGVAANAKELLMGGYGAKDARAEMFRSLPTYSVNDLSDLYTQFEQEGNVSDDLTFDPSIIPMNVEEMLAWNSDMISLVTLSVADEEEEEEEEDLLEGSDD